MIKLFLMLFAAWQFSVVAQPNYLMTLNNPKQISSNSFEFEIIIKSTDSSFTLSSYQCSFSFDLVFSDQDSIRLVYIDSTSQLFNPPRNIIGLIKNDGINELIFTSGIGNDLIDKEEKIVGRFKIIGSMELTVESMALKWNFEGSVNTILTDASFSDITVPEYHQNFQTTVSSTEVFESVPSKFEINQNFPNPFNPTTTINYSIPSHRSGRLNNVQLKIYDLIGREITTLVNQKQKPGNYSLSFNGSNLSSGVYFYVLLVEENANILFKETNKMILLK